MCRKWDKEAISSELVGIDLKHLFNLSILPFNLIPHLEILSPLQNKKISNVFRTRKIFSDQLKLVLLPNDISTIGNTSPINIIQYLLLTLYIG